jgi:osmotically-inducible protein OsmY
MKTRYWLTLALILALGFGGTLTNQVSGQTALEKIFGKKTPPAPPPQTSLLPGESDARLIEILVELAWLGDPVTFPFYIEARVEGPVLHVRGNVPSKAVHDYAIKLTHMNTSLPVVDDIKENPNLKVPVTRMSTEQLQNVVRSALRESLPRQAKNLQMRCTADGQVAISGNVDTFEQKLQISQALRRLHGCTVARNLTRVGSDPEGLLAKNLTKPADKATNVGGSPTNITGSLPNTGPLAANQSPSTTEVVKSSPLGSLPPEIMIKTEPPLTPPTYVGGSQPAYAGGSPANVGGSQPTDVPSVPVNKTGPRLTLPQIQKRIKDACPKAKEVIVTQKPTGEVKVEIHVREDGDIDTTLNRVYALPEMESYRLEVNFVIGVPGKN